MIVHVVKMMPAVRPTYVVPTVQLYSPTPMPYAAPQWVGFVVDDRVLQRRADVLTVNWPTCVG